MGDVSDRQQQRDVAGVDETVDETKTNMFYTFLCAFFFLQMIKHLSDYMSRF